MWMLYLNFYLVAIWMNRSLLMFHFQSRMYITLLYIHLRLQKNMELTINIVVLTVLLIIFSYRPKWYTSSNSNKGYITNVIPPIETWFLVYQNIRKRVLAHLVKSTYPSFVSNFTCFKAQTNLSTMCFLLILNICKRVLPVSIHPIKS